MFILENVPVRDWAALAVGLTGLLVAWLESRDRLPKWARSWLHRLGPDRVEQAIAYAAKMEGLSPEERRYEAAAYLVRLSKRQLGFPVPGSIANLLVEYAYQYWKRR